MQSEEIEKAGKQTGIICSFKPKPEPLGFKRFHEQKSLKILG
jgi:hypothetical protein